MSPNNNLPTSARRNSVDGSHKYVTYEKLWAYMRQQNALLRRLKQGSDEIVRTASRDAEASDKEPSR